MKEVFDGIFAITKVNSETILGIVVGIVVTSVATIILNRRKAKLEYKLKLFDMYHSICNDIIETILPLTSMSLYNSNFKECNKYVLMRQISDVYYKYYNYLPDEVLLSMTCLYCCLKSDGTLPYIFKRNIKKTRIIPCITEAEAQKLQMKTTLSKYLKKNKRDKFLYRIKDAYEYAVKNITTCEKENKLLRYVGVANRFYKKYNRRIEIRNYPKSFIVNIQARYVIICIDKYFGSNHLLNWNKKMKKHALEQ